MWAEFLHVEGQTGMKKLIVAFRNSENAQHTYSVSATKSNTLMPYKETVDCSEKRKETRLYFVGRKQKFVYQNWWYKKQPLDFKGLSN